VCVFGGTEGIQADISDDYTVTCRTPPNLLGADSIVTLQFCDSGDFDGNEDALCNYAGSIDATTVVETFVYAGIQTFHPISGPTCGGTTVTVRGNGFQFFNSLYCQFAGKTTPATLVDNHTITCNTPNVDVRFAKDLIRCSPMSVIAIPRTGNQVIMRTDISFQYGVPQAISVSPNTSLITESKQVTVIGEFFNGGGLPGSYLCRWGNFPPQPAQNIVQLNSGQYQLICNTPTLSNTPNLTVGYVDFEISFDCPASSRFTTDNLQFLFTQVAYIDSFSPEQGPEFGGTNVTVNGYFAGGTQYFCGFGQILVSALLIDDSTLSCISPAHKEATGTQVPFFVSIDDANTLIPADDSYIYQNVKCSAAGSLNSAMLLALLIILFTMLLF